MHSVISAVNLTNYLSVTEVSNLNVSRSLKAFTRKPKKTKSLLDGFLFSRIYLLITEEDCLYKNVYGIWTFLM